LVINTHLQVLNYDDKLVFWFEIVVNQRILPTSDDAALTVMNTTNPLHTTFSGAQLPSTRVEK